MRYPKHPGRHIFIYDSIFTDRAQEWRFYEGVILQFSSTCYRGDGGVSMSAQQRILYVDQFGGVRITDLEHISERCGAATWVFAHEFELLRKDFLEDYERRGLWHEAKADLDRIVARLEGFR